MLQNQETLVPKGEIAVGKQWTQVLEVGMADGRGQGTGAPGRGRLMQGILSFFFRGQGYQNLEFSKDGRSQLLST